MQTKTRDGRPPGAQSGRLFPREMSPEDLRLDKNRPVRLYTPLKRHGQQVHQVFPAVEARAGLESKYFNAAKSVDIESPWC